MQRAAELGAGCPRQHGQTYPRLAQKRRLTPSYNYLGVIAAHPAASGVFSCACLSSLTGSLFPRYGVEVQGWVHHQTAQHPIVHAMLHRRMHARCGSLHAGHSSLSLTAPWVAAGGSRQRQRHAPLHAVTTDNVGPSSSAPQPSSSGSSSLHGRVKLRLCRLQDVPAVAAICGEVGQLAWPATCSRQ